ncbi:MAG: DNA-binding protein [Pseudomonas sp.]|nr:DNA-binding protein [Pseudomonas sp.]
MNENINDRALLLLGRISLSDLAETNSKEYVRWQNIKRGSARIGATEIEELGKFFPNYRYWLISGELMPDAGQTSPAFDEANEKLTAPNVG